MKDNSGQSQVGDGSYLHGATSNDPGDPAGAEAGPAETLAKNLAEEKKFWRKLPRLRKKKRKIHARLRRAQLSNDAKKIRSARRALEGSSAVRICAAVDADGRLPAHEQLSFKELFTTAAACTWNHPLPEPVQVWGQPKPNGGVRPLSKFGPMNRTMQFAIRDELSPNYKPKPFQYDAKGRKGVPDAIRDVAAAIVAGYIFVGTADVIKFFQSFVAEELHKMLHLPWKVIANVVVGDKLSHETNDPTVNYSNDLLDQARRGGPQGSALSPLIGSMIISRLDWTGDVILINWVDNFLLLGKSKQAVEEAADALFAKVMALPGGHFKLKVDPVVDVFASFEFVGHRFSVTNDHLMIEPSRPEGFFGRLHDLEMKALPFLTGTKQHEPDAKVQALRFCGDMLIFIKSWGVSFSACDADTHQEYLSCALYCLNDYRLMLGVTWDELEKHKNPHAEWKIISG